MNNKKIIAGIVAVVVAGVLVSELVCSKKTKKTAKKKYRRAEQISADLKDRFNDFVDHLQVKAKGILK